MAGNFQPETIQSAAFWDCGSIVCIIPTLSRSPQVAYHIETNPNPHHNRDSLRYPLSHTPLSLSGSIGGGHSIVSALKKRGRNHWPTAKLAVFSRGENIRLWSWSMLSLLACGKAIGIRQFCGWSRTRVCHECRGLSLKTLEGETNSQTVDDWNCLTQSTRDHDAIHKQET